MAEFTHHANRVLQAAGISPDTHSAFELIRTLAEHARDWADRAAAMGGQMDAGAATRVAALALVSDPDLHKRLEDLEVDAIELLLKVQAAAAAAEPAPPSDRFLRRRRWGDEAQPLGSAAQDPFAPEYASYPVAARTLVGVPVYAPDGEPIGAIERVIFGNGGRDVTGVTLCGSGPGH
jgi:hypothetical protein